MKIVFIRHGKTEGNLNKCYIGSTNQPLCKTGIEELKRHKYPQCGLVFASPLIRCTQTAEIIYPKQKPIIVPDLREMDFGDFENKNYEQLKNNPDYLKWLNNGGNSAFPGGELPADFKTRCVKAFENTINILPETNLTAAFVVHGGTIMAIMSNFCQNPADYYDYQTANGNGYVCNWENGKLKNYEKLF